MATLAMTQTFKVAVLGATGLVGQTMLRILEERAFPVSELVPLASPRSAGSTVRFAGSDHEVLPVSEQAFKGVQLALFSAGAGPSREWAPVAAAAGALVVDNSSAFRMDPDVPLCVPELNLESARNPPNGVIANPNCSTIQLVVALGPLHRESPLTRIVVSTYQAVSGAGRRATECLEAQRRAVALGETPEPGALGDILAADLLMHWKPDADTGYQEEELKLIHESRKILDSPNLRVTPTCVRVPVTTGHAEAVAAEFERPITVERARELLRAAPGVEIHDDIVAGIYPKPSMAAGRDPVLVGRVREDLGNPGGICMYVVADNLRKGAALNAVQIAEGLLLA